MLKKIIVPVLLSLFGIGATIYFVVSNTGSEKISAALGIVPLAWLIILASLVKIKVPFGLQICYYVFIFLALCLGAVLRFYDYFFWWDILLHTTFGYIGCIIGLFILGFNKKRVSLSTVLFFCFFASMAMGGIWEIMEFTMDNLVGSDTQHNIPSKTSIGGVNDTMEDMISNLCGAIVFIIHYVATKNKQGFFYNFEKDFYEDENLEIM